MIMLIREVILVVKEKYESPQILISMFDASTVITGNGISLPDIDFDKSGSGENEKVFK